MNIKEFNIKEFVKDRDRVLTAAVMNEDWDGVREFALRWNGTVPDDEDEMKAGVYKAVQECNGISQTVKNLARKKCLALGFNPTICYE